MSHSLYKIWLHAVFSTKNRLPLITSNVEKKVFNYIKTQLVENGCPVRIVNGIPDHVHLLFLQNPNKTVAEIVKQVKGSSSHWVNQNELVEHKFAWQTGYGVFSVSESGVDKVFEYIKNQKEHHKKYSFTDEFDKLVKLHNIKFLNG